MKRANFTVAGMALAAILIAQAAIPYLAGAASQPGRTALRELPQQLRGWNLAGEMRLSEDVLGALAPDDYLARQYERERDHRGGELLVAYFKDQTEGFGPHSPKVCLPASGWETVVQKQESISGTAGSFPVNHFVIQQGEQKSVVLYWYHTAGRETVGEIEARLWLAWDSMMWRGTDIALVRLIVPVAGNDTEGAAEAARDMARTVHENLRRVWRVS